MSTSILVFHSLKPLRQHPEYSFDPPYGTKSCRGGMEIPQYLRKTKYRNIPIGRRGIIGGALPQKMLSQCSLCQRYGGHIFFNDPRIRSLSLKNRKDKNQQERWKDIQAISDSQFIF